MTNPKHTDTSRMTEAEALDMAAKAAGWGSWEYVKNHCDHSERPGIRAHAKTIVAMAELMTACEQATTRMELMRKVVDKNAALKAEIERLNAILSEMNDTDVIAKTMAENERLRNAMVVMDNTVRELTEALEQIAKPCSVVVEPSGKAGEGWKKMYHAWRKIAVDRVDIARAALKENDNGDR